MNGDQDYCLPSTINVSFHGIDAEGVFLAVKEDYAFSNGSACNSGNHAPSYVLTAMGLDDSRISEAIRISWNHNTKVNFSALGAHDRTLKSDEIDKCAASVIKALKKSLAAEERK